MEPGHAQDGPTCGPVHAAYGSVPPQRSVPFGAAPPLTPPVPEDESAANEQQAGWRAMIDTMDEEAVRSLLSVTASTVGWVATAIGQRYGVILEDKQRAYDQQIETTHREAAAAKVRVVDFSRHCQNVDYILNEKYQSKSCNVEYKRSFRAVDEIEAIVEEMRATAASVDASIGTKIAALDAMREIGETILNGPSKLGSEVRKKIGYGSSLDGAMTDILKTMTLRDRKAAASSRATSNEEALYHQVKDLAKRAEGYFVFDKLPVVLDMFIGVGEESEEEEGETDGEEDGSDGEEDA